MRETVNSTGAGRPIRVTFTRVNSIPPPMPPLDMVPHLTTSLTGPLRDLERQVLDRRSDIEHWLRNQFIEHEVPFYSSVDLRNSGFKLAPVDLNLFPGGFNNLNPDFMVLCIHAAISLHDMQGV